MMFRTRIRVASVLCVASLALAASLLAAGCSKKESTASEEKKSSANAAHEGHEGHEAGAEPAADEKTAAATTTTTTTTLVHQPGAKVGDRTMCPVMGGDFEVTADSPSTEHEGQKVYFCCPGCDAKFAEDPQGKLGDLNAKIDAANAAGE